MLLQIPALVLFSAIHGQSVDPVELIHHTFKYVPPELVPRLKLTGPRSLIFPQWDMVTVILCVFLLSYVYGEGKVRSPFSVPSSSL